METLSGNGSDNGGRRGGNDFVNYGNANGGMSMGGFGTGVGEGYSGGNERNTRQKMNSGNGGFGNLHSFPQQQQQVKLCRYGPSCNGATTWCNLQHNVQRPCNYGSECIRKETCPFNHGTKISSSNGGNNRPVSPKNFQSRS